MKTYPVRHLFKSYGEKKVITDLSFTLEEGRLHAVRGPSGSGKTTLLRLLSGLEEPDSGDVSSLAPLKKSMVFQENRLCMNLSALANVSLVSGRRTAEDILVSFGLGASLHESVRYLSGGMQRRVALARALAAPFDILFLDEPFTGLDAETKGEVIAATKKLCRGRTIVLVTHDASEIEAMGTAEMISLS